MSKIITRSANADKKKFRIEIPNVIDDLKLPPRAFRLYVHMRRVAGETGKCWENAKTLSLACDMSTGSVSTAKKLLLKKREQLGGKSLIYEIENTKRSDCYGITDIWKCNLDHAAALASARKTKASVQLLNDARSNIEGQVQLLKGNGQLLTDERSTIETKKEPLEEVTIEERTIEEDPDPPTAGIQNQEVVKAMIRHKPAKEPIRDNDEVLRIEQSLSTKFNSVLKVIPDYKNQKDAIRQLARKIDEGICNEDDVMLCLEYLMDEHNLAMVTPITILNSLGKFLDIFPDGKPHASYYFEQYGSKRPELYSEYECSCC